MSSGIAEFPFWLVNSVKNGGLSRLYWHCDLDLEPHEGSGMPSATVNTMSAQERGLPRSGKWLVLLAGSGNQCDTEAASSY